MGPLFVCLFFWAHRSQNFTTDLQNYNLMLLCGLGIFVRWLGVTHLRDSDAASKFGEMVGMEPS